MRLSGLEKLKDILLENGHRECGKQCNEHPSLRLQRFVVSRP